MQFLTSTAALLTLLPFLAAAAPLESPTPPGNVLLCTGANYTGECTTINSQPFNKCQQIPAPYFKNLGSIKPDAGAYCRITFTEDTCSLHGDAFIFPEGVADLHHYESVNGAIVDAGSMVTSIKCQECTACA